MKEVVGACNEPLRMLKKHLIETSLQFTSQVCIMKQNPNALKNAIPVISLLRNLLKKLASIETLFLSMFGA